VRIYAALCSRRGCSQVLFLGILSPHIYDQLEVATWGGCDLLDGCQTCFQRKSRCSTPALPVIRRNYEYVEYNLIHTSTTNAKATILPRHDPHQFVRTRIITPRQVITNRAPCTLLNLPTTRVYLCIIPPSPHSVPFGRLHQSLYGLCDPASRASASTLHYYWSRLSYHRVSMR